MKTWTQSRVVDAGSGISETPIEAADQPKQAAAVAPEWQFRGSPVIRAGDLKHNGVWNDPCVLREGDGYVMYLSSSTSNVFKPPILPFRAVSSDGVHWELDPPTPLLSVTGTPFVSIETPTVVRFGGRYHMYFTGIYPEGSLPTMAIGHATSEDGISWRLENGGKPIIKATGAIWDWNGFLVAEPGAMVHQNRVWLYFTAMGARPGGSPPQVQVIALATSSDGWRFGAPEPVLAQTDRYPATQGYPGYSTPSPMVHEGKVHLFYDVARYDSKATPSWSQVALHHAVSEDGRTFQESAEAIVTRENLGYPKGEVSGPCAIVDGDTVRVWFLGHAGAEGFMPEFLYTGKTDGFGIRTATMPVSGLAAAPTAR